MNKKHFGILFIIIFSFTLFSCATTGSRGECIQVSRNLTDSGIKSSKQLYKFFMANNPNADKNKIKTMTQLYISECAAEGINSDCAFVQMCLETGFMRFGGLVTEDMNNFCGLGAMDEEHRGEKFENLQEGIRAHVQHLHAYATTEDVKLNNPLIDSRYKWVSPRGKAPTVYELSMTWAMDRNYGNKLNLLLKRLEQF